MGVGASVQDGSMSRKQTGTFTEHESSVPTMVGTKHSAGTPSYMVEKAECEAIVSEVEVSKTDATVVALPRGGILVNHSQGAIQFGLPPETIKDALLWGLNVPSTFVVLGDEMFDRQMGINIAEFEFPAYFNYFVFGKSVTLITTENVEKRVRTIFRETLLGPVPGSYDLSHDFSSKLPGGYLSKQNQDTHWPDFVQEGLALDSQREHISVDKLLNFKILDRASDAPRGGSGPKDEKGRPQKATAMIRPSDQGKVVLNPETNAYVKWNAIHKKYLVREGKRTIAQVDHKFLKPRIKQKRTVKHEPFDVPVFGVTMLGTSHGFDPKGTTTGFVVWVNRRGIMVDPPPDSADVLRDMAIPSRLIDGMILTHCHADHDAGAFQKILADSSIKIYTTQTIMDSFITKYSAISNLDEDFLRGLFLFQKVTIGQKLKIHGGQWDFFYSLHVIPTIGFEVKFADEGIVYSGDTCTNPKLFDKMRREKRIGKGRWEDLAKRSPVMRARLARRLPDGTTVPPYRPHILHEAGVPPIHTPLELLAKLPAEVRERLFVVHVDQKQVVEGKYAKRLKSIPQWSTLRIFVDTKHPDILEKQNGLPAIISTVPFFRIIKDPALIEELLSIGMLNFYKQGTVLAKPGDKWDTSYLVRAGVALESSGEVPADAEVGSAGSAESNKRMATGERRQTAMASTMPKPTFYYVGDFFGEQSLITEVSGDKAAAAMAAMADADPSVVQQKVVAHTDLYTIDFPRKPMLRFLNSFEIGRTSVKKINAVARARVLETWHILRLNETLDKIMNRVQQQEFQTILSLPKRYAKYEVIFNRGEKQGCMYLVGSGSVNLFFKPQIVEGEKNETHADESENVDLGPGTLVGDVNCLKSNKIAHYTLTAKTECTVYEVARINLTNFLNKYPGVKLQCIDRRYIR